MNRIISVSLLPKLSCVADGQDLRCAVVIDVLRATSVMSTAGRAGVRRMFTCRDIDDARQMAERLSAEEGNLRPLLCGERQCQPIDGFDLGNSPAEYLPNIVRGKDMILTTTNGTLAIESVITARRLLIGSFLNLDATVDAISSEGELQIVCAGTNGQISYEDVLMAGAIIDRLNPSGLTDKVDDSARLAWSAWRLVEDSGQTLEAALRHSLGGRNLMAVGFDEDIARCARINSIDGTVQRFSGNEPIFQYRK